MRAAVLDRPRSPLAIRDVRSRALVPGEIRLRVLACGVCRTDVHLQDGELPGARFPIVPGHQVVGEVVETTSARFATGERAGVPWLARACGACHDCRSGRENLCDFAEFTGCHRDGGFADECIAWGAFAIRIPERDPLALAPLLCGGLIGFRAYRMAGEARRLGVYGFGSAAHLVAQIAVHDGRDVYAFTRAGDQESQRLARDLGARWAGASSDLPPERLDAAILFAPAGELVPLALKAVAKGGSVICAGIHMTDIPSFPYELLWGERVLRSVANLTRDDAVTFFERTHAIDLVPRVTRYALDDAQQALDDLRGGKITGSAVIVNRFQ